MKISHLPSAVFCVKNKRLGKAIAAGAVAMSLLLGTATARAEPTAERE